MTEDFSVGELYIGLVVGCFTHRGEDQASPEPTARCLTLTHGHDSDEKALNRFLGQALVDHELRDELLGDPAKALAGHGLPMEFVKSLPVLKPRSLEELA